VGRAEVAMVPACCGQFVARIRHRRHLPAHPNAGPSVMRLPSGGTPRPEAIPGTRRGW
jgi:hypothetical protein